MAGWCGRCCARCLGGRLAVAGPARARRLPAPSNLTFVCFLSLCLCSSAPLLQLEDFDPEWESREKGECEALNLVRPGGDGESAACTACPSMHSTPQHVPARRLCLPPTEASSTLPPPPARPSFHRHQEIAALTVQREQLQRGADAVEAKRGALVAQAASLKEVGWRGWRHSLALSGSAAG